MDRLKINNLIHKFPVFISFLLFALLSCGDEYLWDDVDCADCYTPKPKYGPVTISVTADVNNKKIPIKIFKGMYLESYRNDYSSALYVDTLTESKTIFDLEPNEYYSVEAEYTRNGKKILVVNGDKLKRYQVSDKCDETCWIFKGGDIDVTLKK